MSNLKSNKQKKNDKKANMQKLKNELRNTTSIYMKEAGNISCMLSLFKASHFRQTRKLHFLDKLEYIEKLPGQ